MVSFLVRMRMRGSAADKSAGGWRCAQAASGPCPPPNGMERVGPVKNRGGVGVCMWHCVRVAVGVRGGDAPALADWLMQGRSAGRRPAEGSRGDSEKDGAEVKWSNGRRGP
jgi:hypothetical protein